MTKFKPDSEESRAWVRFMAAAIQSRSADEPYPTEIADVALEDFKKRLDTYPPMPPKNPADAAWDMLKAKSIDDLTISVRSYNGLYFAKIATIGQLVTLRRSDILKMKNMGKKSLKDIEEALDEYGLQLVPEKNS